MEDAKRNMENLFAKAKAEKVDYKVAKVAAVVGGTSMLATAAVAATTKSAINLSTMSIMIGSIVTVTTALVIVNTGGEEKTVDTTTEAPVKKEVVEVTQPNLEDNIKEIEFVPTRIIKEETEIEVLEIQESEELIVFDDLEEEELDLVQESCECDDANGGDALNLEVFNSIELNVPLSVNIQQGTDFGVKFVNGGELSSLIDFKVTDKVLYIQPKKGKEKEYRKSMNGSELEIMITMGEVKGLVVNGSGNIYAKNEMESKNLDIVINGSGEVILEKMVPDNFEITVNGSGDVGMHGNGNTVNGKISINGSGEACTRSIDVDNMEVVVLGSGDATINCSKKLDVTILGSGDVCYRGNAEVNSSQLGSGDLINCDKEH